MNMLLVEIIGCLFAVAFLSLFIGWAIRSSMANREAEVANAGWESKHSELELRYQEETEQLGGKVDQLQTESQQLSSRNDSISESLRENEISIHKARTDAIELNRQQADTQERLQRIIAQKDDELKRLRTTGASAAAAGVAGTAGLAAATAKDTQAKLASLAAKREALESERTRIQGGISDDQATIAIDPQDLPAQSFDQTVRIDADQPTRAASRSYIDDSYHEEDADKTQTLDNDQTILLDEPNRKKPPFDDNER